MNSFRPLEAFIGGLFIGTACGVYMLFSRRIAGCSGSMKAVLHALATAVPPAKFTQSQCWDIVEKSPVRARLHKLSRLILHSILRGDHGIATRHFAAPDIDKIFDRSSDELNAIFRTEGPDLAARALSAALAQAQLKASDLDALLICTCTGYLCPGLTSYVAQHLGLMLQAHRAVARQSLAGHE
jgi:predicted naringenin-chalcone synthase